MVRRKTLPLFQPNQIEPQIFQLKVVLQHIKPPIWRRLLISSHCTFLALHHALQDSFYWSNYHLHEFFYRFPELPHWEIHIQPVEPEDQDIDESLGYYHDIKEDELRLCDVFSKDLKTVKYLYDFGDNWEHLIRLERIFPNDGSFRTFLCVGGKRTTPPEDCGGPYGYMELLEAMEDANHPDHEDLVEWVGGSFDPNVIQSPMTKMSPKKILTTYGPEL